MKPDIVRRYRHNPILTKAEIPYPVETVHNAAVVKHENQYIMLFHSHLRTGRFNGAHPKRIRWLTTQAIDQRRLQLQRNLQGSTQRCKFGTCKISESDPDNQTSEASRERS